MIPATTAQRLLRGAGCPHANAKDRIDGRHWVEAPVESEDELVQVGRQMPSADAVVGAQEPSLEVGEDQVDHGERLVGSTLIVVDGDGVVRVAQFGEAVVPDPVVGYDRGAR